MRSAYFIGCVRPSKGMSSQAASLRHLPVVECRHAGRARTKRPDCVGAASGELAPQEVPHGWILAEPHGELVGLGGLRRPPESLEQVCRHGPVWLVARGLGFGDCLEKAPTDVRTTGLRGCSSAPY